MEILINNSYGGFGFSNFAIIEWFKRTGTPVWYYEELKSEKTYVNGKAHFAATYKKISEQDIIGKNRPQCLIAVVNKDYGDEVKDFYRVVQKDSSKVEIDDDKLRVDPVMIGIYKEYGAVKVSGPCANLRLENVKKGQVIKIEEYDGLETIKVVYDPDWETEPVYLASY